MGATVAAGLFMGSVTFVLFERALSLGMSHAEAQNLILLLLVLFENVHALNCRSEHASLVRMPLRSNPFLIWAVIAAQGLHILAMHVPILNDVLGVQPVSLATWAAVAGLSLSLAVLMEIWKAVLRRRADRRGGLVGAG